MEKYKICPQCGSKIHIVAHKCKYCGAHQDELSEERQSAKE